MNKLNFNRRVNTQIRKTGYGHWSVTMDVYGKPFSFTTTNSSAIDDFDDDSDRRIASGYRALRAEAMRTWRARR
jgi:hypothetical protein